MLLATLGGEGLQYKFDCYIFEKCQWKNLTSLTQKLRFASLTTLINSTIVIIGGEKDSKNLRSSIMSLNETTWIPVANLTKQISRHCSVVVKEDTVYIIGGMTESSFSEETISFKLLTKISSTMGVRLNRGRQLHSCARLNDYHIIVVGGRDARGALKSVETLDTRTSKKWIERKNLELPLGISYAQIVTTNPSGIANRVKLGYYELLGAAKFVCYNQEFIIIGIVYGITLRFGTKKCVHYNREFIRTEFVITKFDCNSI
jgi:hypothetical protein